MSALEFPVLDGIAASWADIQVKVSPLSGSLIGIGAISAIDSGWTVEVGEQKEGGRVIKRTRGSVAFSASWTLYASGYQQLLRALVAIAPVNAKGQKMISLAHFLVHVQFTPPGSDDILEYKIKGCRLTERTLAAAEGNDAQQIEMTLSTSEVVDIIDGVEVVPI